MNLEMKLTDSFLTDTVLYFFTGNPRITFKLLTKSPLADPTSRPDDDALELSNLTLSQKTDAATGDVLIEGGVDTFVNADTAGTYTHFGCFDQSREMLFYAELDAPLVIPANVRNRIAYTFKEGFNMQIGKFAPAAPTGTNP